MSTNTSGFSVCFTLSHGHQTEPVVVNTCHDRWCHGLGLAEVSALLSFLVLPFLCLVFRIPEQRVTHSCQLFSPFPDLSMIIKRYCASGGGLMFVCSFQVECFKAFLSNQKNWDLSLSAVVWVSIKWELRSLCDHRTR